MRQLYSICLRVSNIATKKSQSECPTNKSNYVEWKEELLRYKEEHLSRCLLACNAKKKRQSLDFGFIASCQAHVSSIKDPSLLRFDNNLAPRATLVEEN